MWLFCLFWLGFSQLASECTEGEYEVTGHDTGVAVQMNYTSSTVLKQGDKTYLQLDFLVPDMYFYSEQNVSGQIYDRSFQITFHDRTMNPEIYNACYSLRSDTGNEHCPEVLGSWTTAEDENDNCKNVVTGTLPWDELMRADFHDASRILITESNRTINGFNTPTWEVYMMAIIETWAGFEEVSPSANPAIANQLTINEERYSYYEIPFRLSFPQQITLVAPPIRVAAPMVTLYAVIQQEIQDINFNPQDGENFGTVELVIKTQTQYPFGLRNFTDPVAPAIIRTISGDIDGDPEWISSQNPEVCVTVDGSEDNYLCEQEWTVLITPNLCDVSGEYQMEMWAICFTDVDGCALDDLAPSRDSNTWTNYLDFTIEAQNFCPQIIDEITVNANINAYADPRFICTAVPGQESCDCDSAGGVPGDCGVFSNDYVWFEVVYTTKSLKSGLDFSQGDDSLIEMVRPTLITMTVAMDAAPLQFEVVRTYGDVSGTDLVYTVELCRATPAAYPYNDTDVDECFNEANMGWNAINYLDFQKAENNIGLNPIDLNEIGFSFRLDERVIPVDLPNDVARVTIDVESEVYYFGNDNPAPPTRRRTYEVRRNLQELSDNVQLQTLLATEVFPLTARSSLSWCSLNADRTSTFQLDIAMDPMQIPDMHSVEDDIMDLELVLAQHYQTQLNNFDVLRVEQCAEDGCYEIWDQINGKSSGTTKALDFVRYYVFVPSVNLAQQLQDELYNGGSIYQTEWFHPSGSSAKRLRDFKIDQCAGDFGVDASVSSANSEELPQIDDGASHLLTLMVLLAMALMF